MLAGEHCLAALGAGPELIDFADLVAALVRTDDLADRRVGALAQRAAPRGCCRAGRVSVLELSPISISAIRSARSSTSVRRSATSSKARFPRGFSASIGDLLKVAMWPRSSRQVSMIFGTARMTAQTCAPEQCAISQNPVRAVRSVTWVALLVGAGDAVLQGPGPGDRDQRHGTAAAYHSFLLSCRGGLLRSWGRRRRG